MKLSFVAVLFLLTNFCFAGVKVSFELNEKYRDKVVEKNKKMSFQFEAEYNTVKVLSDARLDHDYKVIVSKPKNGNKSAVVTTVILPKYKGGSLKTVDAVVESSSKKAVKPTKVSTTVNNYNAFLTFAVML